ncbi:helix-turn-helix domain-containing protein [Rhodobacter capsulatus]|uniref:helix-turn-helix domain-containing protein n=1 Tax=Rhodobacter capsulatus TaxID=1061 RepID=UPI0028769EB9|nr:helix-turn-helix domain-containing protein [Rhodobacter capsulatus]MDS0927310.1 helix-turn-helix domain-containing protein [Rhodobacter capsulatus]UYE93251.1 hypothetical protein Jorvik_02 [Rhodobacter phage Jorvik]
MAAAKQQKPYGWRYQKKVKEVALQRGIKGAALAVLGVLLDHCNSETGLAWPCKETMGEQSGASPKTVDRAIWALKEARVIEPVAYLNGGRHRAVCYKFGLGPWGREAQTAQTENPCQNDEKPLSNCPENPCQNDTPNQRRTIKELQGKEPAGRGRAMQEQGAAAAPEPDADLREWIAFAYRAGGVTGEPFAQVRRKALDMQALARGAAVAAA